ncbi:MAG: efflux RND transporter periplasmic adaptor subunit [Bacteroidota bacterium]
MKRSTWITLGIIAGVLLALIIYSYSKADGPNYIQAEAERDDFEIRVTVTGELQAKNSIDITGPYQALRNISVWEISIAHLIPEGTVVDSGDIVAELEETSVMNQLRDITEEIEAEEGEIEKAKIDSSLELRQLRDQIINLQYAVEEAEITLEQSKYESPAVIRQAQISLDKAEREYRQTLNSYELKVKQAEVTLKQRNHELTKEYREKREIEDALTKLVIKAPAPGMVIYEKERDGSKRREGAQLSIWRRPNIATLPDLTELQTITFVNEIDISKIKIGQFVEIGVDAFPEKEFTGVVVDVANIGEQLPNTDAKVFEVLIDLHETDPVLRPSMTTSNSIITKRFEDVVYLPLEAVHSNDSLTFVYRKNNTKQLVLLGEANENNIIIEEGMEEGDEVLLSVPDNPDEYKFAGMELAGKIREKIKQKEEEEKARRQPQPQQEERQGRRPQGNPQERS